jgi:hypothetical protein
VTQRQVVHGLTSGRISNERPYAFLGTWKTEAAEVDVVSIESSIAGMSADGDADGPLLYSIKDAQVTG